MFLKLLELIYCVLKIAVCVSLKMSYYYFDDFTYKKRKNVFLGTVHSFCLAEIIIPFASLYPQYKIPVPIRIISEAEKIQL